MGRHGNTGVWQGTGLVPPGHVRLRIAFSASPDLAWPTITSSWIGADGSGLERGGAQPWSGLERIGADWSGPKRIDPVAMSESRVSLGTLLFDSEAMRSQYDIRGGMEFLNVPIYMASCSSLEAGHLLHRVFQYLAISSPVLIFTLKHLPPHQSSNRRHVRLIPPLCAAVRGTHGPG